MKKVSAHLAVICMKSLLQNLVVCSMSSLYSNESFFNKRLKDSNPLRLMSSHISYLTCVDEMRLHHEIILNLGDEEIMKIFSNFLSMKPMKLKIN